MTKAKYNNKTFASVRNLGTGEVGAGLWRNQTISKRKINLTDIIAFAIAQFNHILCYAELTLNYNLRRFVVELKN